MASVTLPRAASRRILLVEDEAIVRDSVRRVLQFDGHSVEARASGEEALALLHTAHFDLVVTDYDMPVMKGDRLAVAIKAQWPTMPVLMISAYGEQLRTPGNSMPAVDAILTKPFQLDELRQTVARLAAVTASIIAQASTDGTPLA